MSTSTAQPLSLARVRRSLDRLADRRDHEGGLNADDHDRYELLSDLETAMLARSRRN